MAIRISKDKFKCAICGKLFSQEIECDIHRDKDHDIIYVPLELEDLERLRKFIYFKEEKLLTESLVTTINQFARKAAKRKMVEQENTEE